LRRQLDAMKDQERDIRELFMENESRAWYLLILHSQVRKTMYVRVWNWGLVSEYFMNITEIRPKKLTCIRDEIKRKHRFCAQFQMREIGLRK
jgi:hypothetical protein